MTKRTVFFISDGTGITVETLGLCLLSHFNGAIFEQVRLPFVDSKEKAIEALAKVTAAQVDDCARSIVFMTLVSAEIRQLFEATGALCLDMFGTFVKPISFELGIQPAETIGMSRSTAGNDYRERIEAVNYSLGHDDGISDNGLQDADVILVGVSRSGKTPTSLYLAMQFGVRAANYPLIPEDLERNTLPGHLELYRNKLVGLSIEPERLHRIRNERRPNSQYADLENCRREIRLAENMMRREGISWLDSTTRSVEEMSALILQQMSRKAVKKLVN